MHVKSYLTQRKAARQKRLKARQDQHIRNMLIGMPDALWIRLGENPEVARNYLREESNHDRQN